MNTINLVDKIKAAAKEAFLDIRRQHVEEIICGYALYSDSEGLTISSSVNSYKHLLKLVTEDPSDEVYYRWSPGEWAFEFDGADHFLEVAAIVAAEMKNCISRPECDRMRDHVFESCVEAIEAMKSEGFFADADPATVYVFTVSDSKNSKECAWITRLNKASEADQFKKWMGC